ncbi:hypothetical protein D5085_09485 [Ectothiorhodospiraceae bacterium BW-2]|nr:hypothetical protein D5085_09485 [Ectothiorhodospiraceae bacterium BW-2]
MIKANKNTASKDGCLLYYIKSLPMLWLLLLSPFSQQILAANCDNINTLLNYGVIGIDSFEYGGQGGSASTINGVAISGDQGLDSPTPEGVMQDVAVTFSPLEPDSFPTFSSNSDISIKNTLTISPDTYNKIDIQINNNQYVRFNSGTYHIKELIISSNDTIYLGPGDYYIEKLTIGNSVDLIIDPSGSVNFYIKSKIDAGNQVHFNSTGSTKNFIIYLYSSADVKIGNGENGSSDIDFNGIIYTPHSDTTIEFNNNNDITGAILSKGTVKVGSNTSFTYTDSVKAEVQSAFNCDNVTPSSCGAIFPSGLQNHSSSGAITFNWNGQIEGQDTPIISTTNSITYNQYGQNTCESDDCQPSGSASPSLPAPAFKYSNQSVSKTFGWSAPAPPHSYVLGSQGSNHYDAIHSNVTGNNQVTISDNGAYSEYYIKHLKLNYKNKLQLRAGATYWIETLELSSSEQHIEVIGTGTAYLYILNDVTIPYRIKINAQGYNVPDPSEKLAIYAYGDWNNSSSHQTVSAILYVTGNFNSNSGSHAHYYGALSAGGNIVIGSDTTIHYNAASLTTATLQDFCDTTMEMISDSFEQHPGNSSITGYDGGNGWGSAWDGNSSTQQVIDSQANPLQYSTAGECVEGGSRALKLFGNHNQSALRTLNQPREQQDIYVSILVRFSGSQENNKFMALWFNSSSYTTHPNIGIKMNRGNGSGPEDFFVRTTSSNDSYATDIQSDSTYFIVGKLSKQSDSPSANYSHYQLWVNPSTLESEPPPTTTTGIANSAISSLNSIGFRTVNLQPDDSITIDHIRIGHSWQEVAEAVKQFETSC